MRSVGPCKISQSESLSAYSDGMLDGKSMRRLSAHIEECDECRSALEQLSRLRVALRGTRDLPAMPDPAFWANAYRAARTSVDAQPAAPVRRSLFGNLQAPPRWRVATLAGMGVAAVVLSLVPSSTMRGIVTPPAEASQSIDVNDLVASHASMTSDQPLTDHARLSIILSDTSTRKAGAAVELAPAPINQDQNQDAFDAAFASD